MFDNNYICEPKGIPLVAYFKERNTSGGNRIFTKLHYHSDFEIIYIKHGKAKMIIGNNEFTAQSDSILFINPFEIHYGEALSDTLIYYCIDFDFKMLSLDYETEILTNRLKYINYRNGAQFEPYVKNILNGYRNETPGWQLLVKGSLYMIFAELESGIIKYNPQNNIFAKKVIDFTEKHYSEPITSHDAAEAIGYEQSYFCRAFKKQFQMTFSDYLNLYRTDKAKEFLRNETVSTAAVMAGYSNPSYFAVTFKKINGITPTRYKNNLL